MATCSVCVDEKTIEEAEEIASQIGLTLDEAVNVLLYKFVEEKGFPFPVKLKETQPKLYSEMTMDEFEQACRKAAAEHVPVPTSDGHIVYALD